MSTENGAGKQVADEAVLPSFDVDANVTKCKASENYFLYLCIR